MLDREPEEQPEDEIDQLSTAATAPPPLPPPPETTGLRRRARPRRTQRGALLRERTAARVSSGGCAVARLRGYAVGGCEVCEVARLSGRELPHVPSPRSRGTAQPRNQGHSRQSASSRLRFHSATNRGASGSPPHRRRDREGTARSRGASARIRTRRVSAVAVRLAVAPLTFPFHWRCGTASAHRDRGRLQPASPEERGREARRSPSRYFRCRARRRRTWRPSGRAGRDQPRWSGASAGRRCGERSHHRSRRGPPRRRRPRKPSRPGRKRSTSNPANARIAAKRASACAYDPERARTSTTTSAHDRSSSSRTASPSEETTAGSSCFVIGLRTVRVYLRRGAGPVNRGHRGRFDDQSEPQRRGGDAENAARARRCSPATETPED